MSSQTDLSTISTHSAKSGEDKKEGDSTSLSFLYYLRQEDPLFFSIIITQY